MAVSRRVTVREWFRVQRGALWASNAQLAGTCWSLAVAIEHGDAPLPFYYIGDFRAWARTPQIPSVMCAMDRDRARWHYVTRADLFLGLDK